MTDAARRAAAEQFARWEGALSDDLLRMFDRQEAVVLARLTGVKARRDTRHWQPPGTRPLDPTYVADPARWALEAAGTAEPTLTRLYEDVQGRVAANLTGTEAKKAPSGTQVAVGTALAAETVAQTNAAGRKIAAQVAKRLNQVREGAVAVTDEVHKVIAQGEKAGLVMADIAEQVQKLYSDSKAKWVERIVSAIVPSAVSEASHLSASEYGAGKAMWVSMHDDKVRPSHAVADGQVRMMGEQFQVGGASLSYPGDPTGPPEETFNCRCSLVYQ